MEIGYVYLRARYYDASTGRFINQDPSMDGGNWYTYCNGNPLLYVDPTGLQAYPLNFVGPLQLGDYRTDDPGDDPWTAQAKRESLTAFWNGFKTEFVGYYEGLANTVMHPIESMKNAPPRDVFSCLDPIMGPALRRDYNLFNSLLQKDYYKAGGIVGNTAGEASFVLGTYGVSSGISRLKGNFTGLKGNLSAKGAGNAARVGEGRANDLVNVTRYGRPGLEPGDWVMPGKNTWSNYIRSFKWDPVSKTNIFAPKSSGQTFQVPRNTVKWPSGKGIDGPWKGIFGQRQYRP